MALATNEIDSKLPRFVSVILTMNKRFLIIDAQKLMGRHVKRFFTRFVDRHELRQARITCQAELLVRAIVSLQQHRFAE